MPVSTEKELEVKDAQRKKSKRATFERLKGKKRAFDEFSITLPGDDEPISFFFKACGGVRYDELMAECQPDTIHKAQGLSYNPTRFAEVLLAEVCKDPQLSADQWHEILASDEWSGGEGRELYQRALGLCTKGFDITPIAAG